MHQLILPDVEEVDHINRHGIDNRRSNLRASDRMKNTLNRSKLASKLALTGVDFDKRRNKYSARIYVDNFTIAVGVFDTAFEAALARDRAMTEWAGSYATYNYGVVG